MSNTFIEAIKTEQKRIQRLINLSGISRKDIGKNLGKNNSQKSGDCKKQNNNLDENQKLNSERGSLYLQNQGQNVYAYERWQEKGQPEKKKYLGHIDSAPVQELFRLKYNEQRLIRLKHDKKLLEKLERQYRMYDFESVVNDMPKAYRSVAKNEYFDQRYEELKQWANADYPKNPYPFPKAEIYAKDGTRMRSKGECIWYNLLLEKGILFWHDCGINFVDKDGNTKTLFADFLIQCFDGSFIIIEHLGRVGNFPYATDFGEKCYWYFQNNFVLGKNFFATSDDPDYGTDSQMIAELVDKIEGMFYGF